MIQIIGWMGCLYLLVKAFEIAANRGNYNEKGDISGAGTLAMWLAGIGAIVFAFWLLMQGNAVPNPNY